MKIKRVIIHNWKACQVNTKKQNRKLSVLERVENEKKLV